MTIPGEKGMQALKNSCGSHAEMTALYYYMDMQKMAFAPSNAFFEVGRRFTKNPFLPLSYTSAGKTAGAQLEVLERMTHSFQKPSFGIHVTEQANGSVCKVKEKVILKKSFSRLLHFQKEEIVSGLKKKSAFDVGAKVLLVPPYSGHYATLCRDTVAALLKNHDVYVAEWVNARDIPIFEGNFQLDDYIEYLIDFLHFLGPDVHIIGVCQPAVPIMAAVALMNADKDPCAPKSMVLMGGPIDTRVNPTKVNEMAKTKPLSWFDDMVIANVPAYYRGALRRVCPGFILLTGFMSLNLERHLNAGLDHFKHMIRGDDDGADAHRRFYNEYRSVLDLPADYFLNSVKTVFQKHELPLGTMRWKGEKVDLKAITETALLTVEGEKDDISGVGQTEAAQHLCIHIPSHKKKHYVQSGVGHYGVFNGRRWRESIAPVISDFIKGL